MKNTDNAIRVAAQALHLAITDATTAGQVVVWPRDVAGLLSISVSDTGKSLAPKLKQKAAASSSQKKGSK